MWKEGWEGCPAHTECLPLRTNCLPISRVNTTLKIEMYHKYSCLKNSVNFILQTFVNLLYMSFKFSVITYKLRHK